MLKLVVYYVSTLYQTVRFVNLQFGASLVLCLSCLLCDRRFVVGRMEFGWVVGWVGLRVQSFHFAIGWVVLKRNWTQGQLWIGL